MLETKHQRLIGKFNEEIEGMGTGGQTLIPDEQMLCCLNFSGKYAACLRFLKEFGVLSSMEADEVLRKIVKRGIMKEFEFQMKNAINGKTFI